MSDLVAIACPDEAAARRAPARLADAVEKGSVVVADVVSSPAKTTAGSFLFWAAGRSDSPRPGGGHGGRIDRPRFGRYLQCVPGIEVG